MKWIDSAPDLLRVNALIILLNTGQCCPHNKQKAKISLSNPQSQGPAPEVKCTVPGHVRQPIKQPPALLNPEKWGYLQPFIPWGPLQP